MEMDESLRKVTLGVIYEHNKILLGMKKRGFGEGNYNGYGGKPKEGETLIACHLRENKEEGRIELYEDKVKLVGKLDFYFPHVPKEKDFDQQVQVFAYNSFEFKKGTPVETEEMKPETFSFNNIPYEKMWPDDLYWLPHVLFGKSVKGKFYFAKNGSVEDYQLEILDEL